MFGLTLPLDFGDLGEQDVEVLFENDIDQNDDGSPWVDVNIQHIVWAGVDIKATLPKSRVQSIAEIVKKQIKTSYLFSPDLH